LSVAIDPMTEQYKWDSKQEGVVLSSFFAGYIITQIPGGWLASKFGGKWVLGLGLLWTSILTLATPIAAHYSIYLLIGVRVLEGIGEGITFPSMYALLGKWIPPAERSRLATLCFCGSYLGTVVGLPVSGVLCGSSFLGGWPSVFYVFGVSGIIWFFIWIPLVYDSPAKDPSISAQELDYIESSLLVEGNGDTVFKVPWKSILTNKPFWALLINHTCANWAFYTLLTWLPSYIKTVLHFDIAKSGILSVLPYIGFTATFLGSGFIADFMIARWFSTTTVRKIFQTLAFTIAGVMLALVGHVENYIAAIAIMTLSQTGMGLIGSGYSNNHLDIGASYAGVLMGITNTAATVPGIVAPILTGLILGDDKTVDKWQIVFYISSSIFAFGLIVWLIFASGKRQF